MDLEEFANIKVTAEMSPEQYASVSAALTDCCLQHRYDPEAQEVIRDIESVKWQRTR